MGPDRPHILLVNPWIHDFAAYDFWARPLGLLTLAAILRAHEFRASYIDCLDRFHPNAPRTDPRARHGRGPYLKTRIPKPAGIEDVPRNYSRYGVLPEWFAADILKTGRLDLVLVTSLMTYWHPGVRETIKMIKSVFPDAPVVLGGVYARLCPDHAATHSGADHVVTEPGEEVILSLAAEHTGFSPSPAFDPADLDARPYPAFDLQNQIGYVPFLTSLGCPFSCAYCASGFLQPTMRHRSPAAAAEELAFWHEKYGVSDFVLYDDAFLADVENHAIPVLEAIIRVGLNIRFHTPNALHIRGINQTTAELMRRAGFVTLRLGLETTGFEQRRGLDHKVTAAEFYNAASCLKNAGFDGKQVGAYLLAGLPGQRLEAVETAIRAVKETGITPVVAYYSPIPRTRLWEKAVAASRYDLEADPVFSNNAVMPCQKEGFSWEVISRLKALCNR